MTEFQPHNLTTDEQIIRYSAGKKSNLVAFLLWFFLCGLGAHRFYTRRYRSALAQLVAVVGGYLLALYAALHPWSDAADPAAPLDPTFFQGLVSEPLLSAGYALMWLGLIWWAVDAFLVPRWIREHNETLAASLQRA